jgi:hypothetical protein
MYRRNFTGIVAQGRTASFLAGMRESNKHQEGRGIRARTNVWGAVTGQTNDVLITSDFNTLDDLERYTDLTANDATFASIRREVRAQMLFDSAAVEISRLAYHSEGLISSEDATQPQRYMRVLSGQVQPGMHRQFVVAISQALEYQKQRGIAATTSVWSAVTGRTSSISVIAEFDSLVELEKFDEMSIQDTEFAALRKATRECMVFRTSHVEIRRNLL